MKCPNCKEHTLVIAERKGIEIDHCPECRGIWLDRGELDKILEKSKEENGYRQDSHRNQVPLDHYQKPYKKRKSFFEEIFD